MSVAALTIFMIMVAYLTGSISSAVLICRLRGLPDPRTEGSGNPGATNVLRIGGISSAALVLLCDMLKGAVPAYVAYRFGLDAVALGLIAVAACIGHIFPIFFGFKGGKGVATAFGAMAPIGNDLGLSLLGTWFVVVVISRYSSLAAMVTALAAPIYTHFYDDRFTVPVAMLSALIIARHKDNIHRLLARTEPKVTDRKSKS
ncbi:glycerol-3-phosphate 1-O-acyltransferase PlsY [Shewanella gelidii]|uniref:Glycerol-3-phosphate acyltransferase n=1 Tax=Shewanella gelidii TaxID=1642821 RepID=A0A917JJV6_9GAMM|nr:glycerol-3-phosphate 1-O-acyltransferase PlsY [Shewanella gelidii]GGI69716.1 glycerol-3-phosphate acyltransferase [Shewanella gelidii]